MEIVVRVYWASHLARQLFGVSDAHYPDVMILTDTAESQLKQIRHRDHHLDCYLLLRLVVASALLHGHLHRPYLHLEGVPRYSVASRVLPDLLP